MQEIVDDIFLSNVKFLELCTESNLQVCLNAWVLKEFGIEERIQLLSLIITTICQNKVEIERFTFIRYQRDMGLASFEFLVSWIEYFIPWQLSLTIILLHQCSDESSSPWTGFAAWMIVQISICLLPLLKRNYKILKPLTNLANFALALPQIHVILFASIFYFSFQYWRFLVSTLHY